VVAEKYNFRATGRFFFAVYTFKLIVKHMNKTPLFVILLLILTSSSTLQAQKPAVTFNKALADSLNTWKDVDQIAANIPSGKYKELPREAWQHYKDSVFGTHKEILENIFNRYGFPGYDLVGKDGAHHFWLMVQHCDKWPAFQEKVLTAMKQQVDKKNADPKDYAYLTDRVLLNTGRKQLYATQVTYNIDSCQAIPRPLQDSLTVNVRRTAMGLEPVEAYLNTMGSMHFEMNRASYEQKGITKPKLYAIKQ